MLVNHDIIIMPVSNTKNVGGHAVSRARPCKIFNSCIIRSFIHVSFGFYERGGRKDS